MNAPAGGMVLEGRYELEEPLGRGGMATVFRARDRRLDRPVAVKVLDDRGPEAAGVAFREDRLTARLAHPHIVTVYDSGETPDGRPFVVMELIDGAPASRLAPLPVGQALAIAEDVAAAVAYAHEQGVVHCDIKPQNVLLDAFGRARLTDFGVASADAAPVGEVVYGSASYIAPERLRGAATSPAVDIYALGALLYFLLSGRPPYSGRSAEEIIAQLQAGPPPPLTALAPGVPPAVDAIVRRAMAPDPADRFPSAAALRDAIGEVRRAAVERTSAFPVAAPEPGRTTVMPRVPATDAEPGSAPPATPAPAT
ncbi:MAG: serine/threonine protein kinase, partial [Chloroflexota bacterium]|nr:serine/threonine protein kinase [Chloroflexota bacterium]